MSDADNLFCLFLGKSFFICRFCAYDNVTESACVLRLLSHEPKTFYGCFVGGILLIPNGNNAAKGGFLHMGVLGVVSRGHDLHCLDMLSEIRELALGKLYKLICILLFFALPVAILQGVGGNGIDCQGMLALRSKVGGVLGRYE